MKAASATHPTVVSPIPRHVAIIMDGNGRWAHQRDKLRLFGHSAGAKAVRRAVTFALKHQIAVLTLYAFSSENWQRPPQEIAGLMKLFGRTLDKEVHTLHQHQVRLRVIGDISRFSLSLQQRILAAESLTKENTGLQLVIAANYGGRWDIVHAAKQFAHDVRTNNLSVEALTEQAFAQYLSIGDLPPVDLLIRTSGEYRISNFLLWQSAYAEFYFTSVLWPDFDEATFADACYEYAQRERRFGNTIE